MSVTKFIAAAVLSATAAVCSAAPVIGVVTGTATTGTSVTDLGVPVTMTVVIDPMIGVRYNGYFPFATSFSIFNLPSTFSAGSIATNSKASYYGQTSRIGTVGENVSGGGRASISPTLEVSYNFQIINTSASAMFFDDVMEVLDAASLNRAFANATTTVASFMLLQSDGGYQGVDLQGVQITFRDQANEVPEPASLALLGMGLVGLATARRRKQA